MLDRDNERWEQIKFSRNEDVEMGKREDQVGLYQKWRHQEGGARITCWNYPGKQKTIFFWLGHCLRRKPNDICTKSLRLEVSGRRSRGRPKRRLEGQHKGRHEEILTDWRHGTISKILDDWNNGLPCIKRWSRKVRTCARRLGWHLYKRQASTFGISRGRRSRNEMYSVELLMAAVKTAAGKHIPGRHEKVKLGAEKKYSSTCHGRPPLVQRKSG